MNLLTRCDDIRLRPFYPTPHHRRHRPENHNRIKNARVGGIRMIATMMMNDHDRQQLDGHVQSLRQEHVAAVAEGLVHKQTPSQNARQCARQPCQSSGHHPIVQTGREITIPIETMMIEPTERNAIRAADVVVVIDK